jgi:hypothetical protein
VPAAGGGLPAPRLLLGLGTDRWSRPVPMSPNYDGVHTLQAKDGTSKRVRVCLSPGNTTTVTICEDTGRARSRQRAATARVYALPVRGEATPGPLPPLEARKMKAAWKISVAMAGVALSIVDTTAGCEVLSASAGPLTGKAQHSVEYLAAAGPQAAPLLPMLPAGSTKTEFDLAVGSMQVPPCVPEP